jgi:hypothetical protein
MRGGAYRALFPRRGTRSESSLRPTLPTFAPPTNHSSRKSPSRLMSAAAKPYETPVHFVRFSPHALLTRRAPVKNTDAIPHKYRRDADRGFSF